MAEWLRQGPAKLCPRVRFPLPPRGRLAQRESASLTRKRSLVQSQYRPLKPAPMGTLAVKRRWVLGRWLACGCRAGLTALWLLRIAAVVPAAVWSGVQLERPEPRSGEDERAGRRRAAADHRRRGRVSRGWGSWVSPGLRGWRSGLTCTHPAPARWRMP